MALTKKQQEAREGKITASQVGVLMSGDPLKVLNLWKLHIGDPSYEEPDLSGVWPVRLGEATEALNLAWYDMKHGKIGRMGEVVDGPEPWMCCTLDAWDRTLGIPVEAKHVGGREPLETIIARYTPQTTWQMLVTGTKQCALSVIMGANEPVVEFLTLDDAYAAELMRRARNFMACVESLTPPVELPPVAAPVAAVKEYDMTTAPGWGVQAAVWIQTSGAVETAKKAERELKAMVPADAKIASGCRITITRNRAGALSLRESKICR